MATALYIANCYAPPTLVNVGAASRHYFHVGALRRAGLDVQVITSDASTISDKVVDREEYPEWVHLIESDRMKGGSFWARCRFYLNNLFGGLRLGLRLEKRPSIVIASTPTILIALQGWLLAIRYRAKLVIDVRDLWADSMRATRYGKWSVFVWLNEQLEAFLYRRADAIACTTPAQLEEVSRLTNAGKEVVCIPNGFDFELINEASEDAIPAELRELRSRYKRLVMFAGKHSEYTDLSTAVDAAKLLPEGTGMVLIGGGYQKPALVQRAHERSIKNVHFLESVPKTVIFRCLELADVLLINYSPNPQWARVLPNKLYDYLYFNKPIVAAVCKGEIGRILEETGNGIRIEPGDPERLAEVLRKDFSINEFRFGGRDYLVEHFRRESLAARFVQLVQEA